MSRRHVQMCSSSTTRASVQQLNNTCRCSAAQQHMQICNSRACVQHVNNTCRCTAVVHVYKMSTTRAGVHQSCMCTTCQRHVQVYSTSTIRAGMQHLNDTRRCAKLNTCTCAVANPHVQGCRSTTRADIRQLNSIILQLHLHMNALHGAQIL